MSELDEFLEARIPSQTDAEREVHNGNVGPRLAMWSHDDPVSVFGLFRTSTGWDSVRNSIETVAHRFSDCTRYELEILASGVSGDLAYTVVHEHTSCSIDGQPQSYFLRVTNIYRREDGEWKLVHRHADRPDPAQLVTERSY